MFENELEGELQRKLKQVHHAAKLYRAQALEAFRVLESLRLDSTDVRGVASAREYLGTRFEREAVLLYLGEQLGLPYWMSTLRYEQLLSEVRRGRRITTSLQPEGILVEAVWR